MCWEGCGEGGCGGVEEVSLQDIRCDCIYEGVWEVNGTKFLFFRAHPYEEPAYEVYKLEDF